MSAITIVGGGMVGLFFAKLLAQAGIEVTIIESKKANDARVSAINAVSKRMLQNLEIWPSINETAYSPLMGLKVWDGVGGAEIHFDGAQVGVPALGAIVENREIVRVLWESLEKDPVVNFICPARPQMLKHSENAFEIILEQGDVIATQMVVGADGARSWVREQMLSEIKERPYDQTAIIAEVETEKAHEQTGWQVFLPTGPLALLPLRDSNRCSIVWSTTAEQAKDLMVMDEIKFNNEINNAFGLRLGEIKRISHPKAIPLVMRHAKQYVKPGMALIGDAAHTIHPLAGQGANLGFMDAACLAQCIIDARTSKRDENSLRVLRRYERWRKGDNTLMLLAMRGFKELFSTSSLWMTQARNIGLNLTNRSNLLKNCFMQLAMGESSDLPEIAI